MDRGTVRNMLSFIPKINLKKLVHLVGFIIRIFRNAQSPERQRCVRPVNNLDLNTSYSDCNPHTCNISALHQILSVSVKNQNIFL